MYSHFILAAFVFLLVQSEVPGVIEAADATEEAVVSSSGASTVEGGGIGGEAGGARSPNMMVNKLTMLSQENQRLRLEMDELKRSFANDTSARIEERRRLAKIELDLSESRVLETQEATKLAETKRAQAAAEAKRLEVEKVSAHEMSDQTRKLYDDRRRAAESEAYSLQNKLAVAQTEERLANTEYQRLLLRNQTLPSEEAIARLKTEEATAGRLAAEASAAAAASALALEAEKRAGDETRLAILHAEDARDNTTALRERERARSQAEAEVSLRRSLAAVDAETEGKRDALTRQRELDLLSAREAMEGRLAAARITEAAAAAAAASSLEVNATALRIAAESAARVREERETEDIRARAAAEKAVADRQTSMEMLREGFARVGEGGRAFLEQHLWTVILALAALATTIYGAREGFGLAREVLKNRCLRPRLVRETSRVGGCAGLIVDAWSSFAASPLCCYCCCFIPCGCGGGRRRGGRLPPPGKNGEDGDTAGFESMVLAKPLRESLIALTRGTAAAHALSAPLRNALFHGPPGTGKTMAVREMARRCGLDYAIMAGGDVAPLGAAAVTEINALFDWARSSPRGVLIFIDEAEAFLGSRAAAGLPHEVKQVLSTVLHATGAQSPHFMLALATNAPTDLDPAMLDRMDEMLHFDLPTAAEREALGALYFTDLIEGGGGGGRRGMRGGRGALCPLSILKRAQKPLCGKPANAQKDFQGGRSTSLSCA